MVEPGRGFWIIVDDVRQHHAKLLIVLVPFSAGCSTLPMFALECIECTLRTCSH